MESNHLEPKAPQVPNPKLERCRVLVVQLRAFHSSACRFSHRLRVDGDSSDGCHVGSIPLAKVAWLLHPTKVEVEQTQVHVSRGVVWVFCGAG